MDINYIIKKHGGTSEEWKKSGKNKHWQHVDALVSSTAEIGGGTVIDKYANVGPKAKIGKNVYIGKGAVIGARSNLGDASYIQPGVKIEPDEVVPKNKIIRKK